MYIMVYLGICFIVLGPVAGGPGNWVALIVIVKVNTCGLIHPNFLLASLSYF